MKQLFTFCLFFCLTGAIPLFAQVTTASLSGLVTDKNDEALAGASVVATHVPSGTYYGTSTRADGRYTLPHVRVGGPYAIKVTYTGFKESDVNIEILTLGQRAVQNFRLEDASVTLNNVEIVARAQERQTGAGSSANSEQIRALPTISRSTADITRVNPMSAKGGSFAGRNDQFNNYSLDGTIFNNPFGLDAATPGGQTDAQPVSLDAIDQINVAIAPYDVTQAGFTGAAINAVTKSGTNEFHGTVFGFYRNKNMYGIKVGDDEAARGDLNQLQTGFSFGGPIIKNKLFFFANLEVERRSDLGSYFTPNRGTGAANESRVLASDMDLVAKLLRDRYQYESGDIENFRHRTNNQKGLLKLDWNIANGHTLTLMGNFLDAFQEKPAHPSAIGRRGPDFLTLQMQNSGYRINNRLYGSILELKSLLSNRISNKFQAGFTAFRDSRDPFSAPFPVLNIHKDGVRYIVAGHEPFSVHNVLDQNVFQINDNVNLFLNKHTLTLGGSLERFTFNNSFNLTAYGFRVFNPVGVAIDTFARWINSGAFDGEVKFARDAFANNNAKDSWALAQLAIGQGALYAQDEWAVSRRLTMTFGLRMDAPLYFDTPEKIQENIDRKGGLLSAGGTYAPDIEYYDAEGKAIKFDHTQLPKGNVLISPRFGFNYDATGDRRTQLRGGSGLFTGRFPFVWIGNQVANPDFFFYCMTDPNFRFPQVWRTNLGIDQNFGNGFKATLDIVHTKDLQAVMVRNYGLRTPGGRLEGVGSRPVYRSEDRSSIFGGPTNAYVVSNTNLGYSLNVSPQITKSWKDGSSVMLAYNFLDAKDAASVDAEISSDAYDRNPANVLNSNTAILQPSLYGNRHRLVGVGTKRFTYGAFATTVTLFTEFVKGGRFSYTYAGDINNDGSPLNDLIYIPTDAELGQMTFSGNAAAQTTQRDALKAFIAQDDYLSDNRGQFAEKYASLSPWYNHWDLRILQDYMLPNKHVLQFSLDILNIGNLFNSDWGVEQFASRTGLAQPIGVEFVGGKPVYSFADQKTTFFNDFSLESRWKMQVGLRYSF
jgi:hypothetical protein